MSTTTLIRRYLTTLRSDQIFTSRDLLRFGSRTAIDSAISRLIECNIVKRLARGIFVLATCTKSFSNFEVARVKAESFGRAFLSHPAATSSADAYRRSKHGDSELVFGIGGFSTSFEYNGQRIELRCLSSRKAALQGSDIGREMNRLWSIGLTSVCRDDFIRAASGWRTFDRDRMCDLIALLPAWITDMFVRQLCSDVARILRGKDPVASTAAGEGWQLTTRWPIGVRGPNASDATSATASGSPYRNTSASAPLIVSPSAESAPASEAALASESASASASTSEEGDWPCDHNTGPGMVSESIRQWSEAVLLWSTYRLPRQLLKHDRSDPVPSARPGSGPCPRLELKYAETG